MPLERNDVRVTRGWLPAGRVKVGITAGASTPDSDIAASIQRVLSFRGYDLSSIPLADAPEGSDEPHDLPIVHGTPDGTGS
jgi:hypothetical protein